MQVSPINCVEVVGVFLFTPCVTDDLFVVRYTVLLCGTIPFEEGYIKKKRNSDLCVFTNPFLCAEVCVCWILWCSRSLF
uniref:Uncharacterized protein n=1 Tax=Anguilla anguilla TaxID=7936 RepID=A0A0E9X5Y6_ANGAN